MSQFYSRLDPNESSSFIMRVPQFWPGDTDRKPVSSARRRKLLLSYLPDWWVTTHLFQIRIVTLIAIIGSWLLLLRELSNFASFLFCDLSDHCSAAFFALDVGYSNPYTDPSDWRQLRRTSQGTDGCSPWKILRKYCVAQSIQTLKEISTACDTRELYYDAHDIRRWPYNVVMPFMKE